MQSNVTPPSCRPVTVLELCKRCLLKLTHRISSRFYRRRQSQVPQSAEGTFQGSDYSKGTTLLPSIRGRRQAQRSQANLKQSQASYQVAQQSTERSATRRRSVERVEFHAGVYSSEAISKLKAQSAISFRFAKTTTRLPKDCGERSKLPV